MSRIIRLFCLVTLITSLIAPRAFAQTTLELRNEAKAAFRSGNYEKAAGLYKTMMERHPDRIEILKEAMWAYWNMGQIDNA